MGKAKPQCRTCQFLVGKLDKGRVVCAHPIMAALHGPYPIARKENCPLWEKYKEEK